MAKHYLNTTIRRSGNVISAVLHNTEIIKLDNEAGTVTFDNGGWSTATTIRRLNQIADDLSLPFNFSRAGGTPHCWVYGGDPEECYNLPASFTLDTWEVVK
jgi:hypothetical protein